MAASKKGQFLPKTKSYQITPQWWEAEGHISDPLQAPLHPLDKGTTSKGLDVEATAYALKKLAEMFKAELHPGVFHMDKSAPEITTHQTLTAPPDDELQAKLKSLLAYHFSEKECLVSDLTKAAEQIAAAIAPKLAPTLAKELQTLENDAVASKQGEATITIKHPDGHESQAKELIGQKKLFTGPVCEVGVALGTTINLGNYSSARCDVSVKIPCAHAELNQVYEYALTWTDSRMTEITAKFNATAVPDKK